MTNSYNYKQITAPLLAWYQQNKRDLPWRKNPTPYQVWVSEIMLQQTRVEAVKEYYLRFMQHLPTLEDLAHCPEEKLLKLWEGLGYYSRARNLQKAAKQILFAFDGQFPSDVNTLRSLAGIGEYTAGAISSIAFGNRVAAIDGNVLRVNARLTENGTPINDGKLRKRLQEQLSDAYPTKKGDCANFTQSLFELGALICKPRTPSCENCPLSAFCKAHQNGTQENYPVLPPKKAKKEERVYVFLIQTNEGFCIRRREEGVLKGMNAFPSATFDNGESAEEILNEWGVYAFNEIKRKKYVHVFTHIKWNITCVWIQTESAPFDTYTLEEIEEEISLPTAFKQCLDIIKEGK